MTLAMTPRERMMTTLSHQEPDRVPLALGGGPYGIVDKLYFQLLDRLKLGDPVPPFRVGHNISYMDDRLLERLHIDTRYVWPGESPSSPSFSVEGTDTFLDAYGQPWKRAFPYYYAETGILSEAVSIGEIDQKITWPDLHKRDWTAGVHNRARYLRQYGDHFIIGRMVASHGPYQTACNLRGTENFLMDMVDHQDFAFYLIERITDTLVELLKSYMQAGGKYFDMVELPGDDYAGNTNLVISPAMFRKFVKPCLQRLVKTVKEYRPNIKVMLHSDGMIQRLLPDFIEIGIDVVHPLEPLPAMNLSDIKDQYGKQLSFLGAIDISHAMPGTSQDVINEVKRRLAELAPGGGYILAPANHLQEDIPAENIVTLYDAARRYGRYPIEIKNL